MNDSEVVGGNGSACSASSDDAVSELCQFWIQGVMLAIVAVAGIIGNMVSVFVLTRGPMASVFNLLLASMTSFDTLYLFTSLAEFSLVESFHVSSQMYDRVFVHLLYPVHNITLTASIFGHVLLAVERYLAVCRPQIVHNRAAIEARDATLITKQVLYYMVPTLVLAVALNLPRWFELKLQTVQLAETNSSVAMIAGTWLRYNPWYVHLYLHWTILLTTGVLPLTALVVLNSRIYVRIKQVRAVRSKNNKDRPEPNYAATLSSIVVMFTLCHLPRTLKTIWELVVTAQIEASGENCSGINPARCLANLNNFVLTLNAAAGFLIYCFVGSFGKKFVDVLRDSCASTNRQQRNQQQQRDASRRTATRTTALAEELAESPMLTPATAVTSRPSRRVQMVMRVGSAVAVTEADVEEEAL